MRSNDKKIHQVQSLNNTTAKCNELFSFILASVSQIFAEAYKINPITFLIQY